jgi:uncharacterized protein (DUF1800 family)
MIRRGTFLGLMLSAGALMGQSTLTATAATRFLEQATWGPTPDAVAHLQQIGFDHWLEEEFAAAPSDIPDAPPGTTGLRTLQDHFFVNALTGQDQLRQRVAFALGQIWVVSGVKINLPQAMAPYLRLLTLDAFGSYYNLMRDVTLSPAMGHYLDMVNNDKPDAAAGKSADENYAREFLQLFTLGEILLNPDGTPALNADQQTVPAYSEQTVQNLARVFTGWTYPPAPGATSRIHNPAYWDEPMVAFASNHDLGTKTLLRGLVLPAGQLPERDLEQALDNVFNHPNVGPFVARQLIEHLVTSNPSPAYIERVSAVFADDGMGMRGHLKAVVRAILLDPEARADDNSPAPGATGGHLREPVLFLTSLLRGLNATVADTNALAPYASQMGQNVYYPPSVFNYFSPNYRLPHTALTAPEFQIYSSATAMIRANFVNTLVFGQVAGVTVDLGPLVQLTPNPTALLNGLDAAFLHGRMSADTRKTIGTAVAAASTGKLKAQTAVYLVAASPEYQIEH